jgi:hypothetical protein
MHDLVFEDHGTVFLVWPLSRNAADWLHGTAPEDAIFFQRRAGGGAPLCRRGAVRGLQGRVQVGHPLLAAQRR